MNWLAIGSINMAVVVMLGAFGAHGLKAMATAEQLAWWQTATQYYFFHALGLVIIGGLIKQFGISQIPAYCLQMGIVLFSGSLYLMGLGAPRWFGAITPIGGMLMIIGWIWLAVVAFKLGK